MTDLFNATLAHREIVQRIRDMFPDETEESLADTIAGESSLEEAIVVTLRAANENDATVAGLLVYVEKLKDRAERLKVRSERLRATALQAAQELDQKQFAAPDFTATVSKGKGKIIVTGKVPETFMRQKPAPDPEPDKDKIGEALKAGVKLPFAELSNAEPHWVVRIK